MAPMVRKPDFLYKPTGSYEGQVAKRPAGAVVTTSEAFERALRAPLQTPQAERVKRRADMVAPFATRSVIESPVCASAPVSVRTAEDASASVLTPGKHNAEPSRSATSPSLSPPPSPSPTKRTAPTTLKPSKSARRAKRNAARAETSPTINSVLLLQTADDEQSVAALLSAEPAAKRAKVDRDSKPAAHESQPAMPAPIPEAEHTTQRVLRSRRSSPSISHEPTQATQPADSSPSTLAPKDPSRPKSTARHGQTTLLQVANHRKSTRSRKSVHVN
jgi:hypothetical protein